MRLTQIRVFLEIVESGSIRAAARKLQVSPPAITKSLRQLEEELHVRLLERTQHGVVVSPAGRVLAARARVIQSELRRAEEDLAHFAGAGGGSVAFGVGPTGMLLIVPDAVDQFRRRYPDTRIRIVEGRHPALLPLVRDETLDFALGLRPGVKLDAGLTFRPLFQHDETVVARRGHPLANAKSLAQLADARWMSPLPRSTDDLLTRVFMSTGLPPPAPAIECDSIPGIVALLAKSDMIALMSRRMLARPPARDALQEIPVADQWPKIAHGIFTRADAPLTRVAAAMAQSVSAVARRLARD